MPAEMRLGGTARCYSEATQAIIDRRMTELAQSFAASHGATAEVSIRWGVPATVNHDEQTEVAIAAATRDRGRRAGEREHDAEHRRRGFLRDAARRVRAPSSSSATASSPDGSYHAVHTPKYDFNDAIIPLGVRYWVGVVRQELALD